MKRKVIFLDIDGTLTEPGKNVPPASALEAIRRARENGHFVYLCSGRNLDMLSPLLVYPFDGVIASSGGYVVSGGKVIYDCPMTKEQTQKALEVLGRGGVFKTVECRDGSFTDEGLKDYLKEHAREGANSELLRWREQVESSLGIRPMSEYQGEPIYKIVVMCENLSLLSEARRVLEEEFAFVIQEADRFGFVNGEIINRSFDKGKALLRVMDDLQIPAEDSIAFGDSMNDLEMMETAALSICMDNGAKALKEISDDICPSVTEDGLYKAFEKYGLI